MPSEKTERFFYFINNKPTILRRKEVVYLFVRNFFGKVTYVKRIFFADKEKDNKETIYVVINFNDLIRMFEIEDTLSFKI